MSGTVPFQTGSPRPPGQPPGGKPGLLNALPRGNTVIREMAPRGRPKGDAPPRASHSFRLPSDLAAQLEDLRWRARKSKSAIVCDALRAHLPKLAQTLAKRSR